MSKLFTVQNIIYMSAKTLKCVHQIEGFLRIFFSIFEQFIRYNLIWGSLGLINCEAVYHEKCQLFQTRLYLQTIPYNLIFTPKFNDSSIVILIISWDYLN
jgi:hypothetical protein